MVISDRLRELRESKNMSQEISKKKQVCSAATSLVWKTATQFLP